MDIASEKIELVQLLLETNDRALIDTIKSILEKNKQEAWEKLSPEQQAAINIEIQKENQADTADF